MRLLFSFARAYPKRSALTFLAVILASLTEGLSLGTVLPLLMSLDSGAAGANTAEATDFGAKMLDFLGSMGISPTFESLLTVILVGLVLKAGLMVLASRQVAFTVAHVATDLRLALLRAFLSTRWEYYIRRPIGALANTVGAEAMQSALAYQYSTAVVAFASQVIVYSVVVLLVSWQVALPALVGGALVMIVLSQLVRVTRKSGVEHTQHLKSLISRLTDSLQSVKPLKSMGRENLADLLLVRDTQLLNDALQSQVFSREAMRSLQEPLITLILLSGIFAAIHFWGLPLATVTVLALVLSKMMARIGKIQRLYQEAVACEGAYFSLQAELQAAQRAREPELGKAKPTLENEIRLTQVDFAYEEREVIRDATVAIPAGKWTSIVGASGEGKTTLIDLVTGLLRPQRGQVLIDGTPLAEIDLSAWRRMIGYVPQETLLLHDSIATNVTLGDQTLSKEDVERALRAAGAWNFVSQLPDKTQSSVGERGALLSGGQRQRIAIARALVHRPKLLILDEATSALDPSLEAEICSTLGNLLGELTILAISHQTGLVEQAEVVYRIQAGSITCVRGAGSELSSAPKPS